MAGPSKPKSKQSKRGGSSDDEVNYPPPPKKTRSSKKHRQRGYSLPREKSQRRSEVTLLLCVFHATTHKWSTEPFRFDPQKINDRQLWTEIRRIFRMDMQKPWRRLFGLKKVTSIVPIGYSHNGVPIRTDPKDFPDAQTFLHAYHHPQTIRPDYVWVDWFVEFDRKDPSKTNGLEFVEGLWANKLAAIAILATIAIVVVSVVWVELGGQLQTVFTVMGFVLSLVAAQIALAALYYQVALPGN